MKRWVTVTFVVAAAVGCGASDPPGWTLTGGKSDDDELTAKLSRWSEDDRRVISSCVLRAPELGATPDSWRSKETVAFEGWERFQSCRLWSDDPVGVVKVTIDTFGSFKPILRVEQVARSTSTAWVEPRLVESSQGHALYQVTLIVRPTFKARKEFLSVDVTSASLIRQLAGDPDVGIGAGKRFQIALHQVPGQRISGPFELAMDDATYRIDRFPLGDSADGNHLTLHYEKQVRVRFAFDTPLLVTRLRWQFPHITGTPNTRFSQEHHLPYLHWSAAVAPEPGFNNLTDGFNWTLGQIVQQLELVITNQLAGREEGVPPPRDIGFDGIEILAAAPETIADAVDLR